MLSQLLKQGLLQKARLCAHQAGDKQGCSPGLQAPVVQGHQSEVAGRGLGLTFPQQGAADPLLGPLQP